MVEKDIFEPSQTYQFRFRRALNNMSTELTERLGKRGLHQKDGDDSDLHGGLFPMRGTRTYLSSIFVARVSKTRGTSVRTKDSWFAYRWIQSTERNFKTALHFFES